MSTPLPRNWRVVGVLTALTLVAGGGAAVAAESRAPTAPAISGTVQTDPQRIITLRHGEELILPPAPKRKFQYDARAYYWSAVAISEADDYTLSLYADKQNSVLLARSSEPRGTQFVVVDSNHAPIPRTYYPTVTGDAGGPSYTIQIDTDNTALTDQPLEVPMSNRDLVSIMDTRLVAGVVYTFRVSAEPDQNPALYLMQSDAEDSRTWYQDRSAAVALEISRA